MFKLEDCLIFVHILVYNMLQEHDRIKNHLFDESRYSRFGLAQLRKFGCKMRHVGSAYFESSLQPPTMF